LLCCLIGALNPQRRVFAEDWTEFRGPTGQGHSSVTGLPIQWGDAENVAWKQEIPGKGWSSPIILGKRLYLTTAVPKGEGKSSAQSLRALCIDAVTGKIVWNVEVFEQPEGAQIHDTNSHASATPITDGKRLFVHFGTHGTACLKLADGDVVWRNQELKYSPVHGNGGSPVLVDNRLIVSCDGSDEQFVVALDPETGAQRWRTPRNLNPSRGFSFGTPLVIRIDGKDQIVSQGSEAVIAYDPETGREIWKVRYPGGYSVVPRPVFGMNLLFVCTGFNTPAVMAIRPQGASGDVTETHVAWQSKKGVPLDPSPLLIDDSLYLISDSGVVSCLEATTGQERWHHRLGSGGKFWASPIYADGKIFAQSEDGEGIVLQPGSDYQELAKNPLHELTRASYAVSDGALFIRTEKLLRRMQQK
jgi:outer membrane protein assembly factor BamB